MMDDLEARLRAVPWICQFCGRSARDIDLGDLCGNNPVNAAHVCIPDYQALAALVRGWLAEKDAEIERLTGLVFSPTGDNHHNAAQCPYCGDPLREAQAKIAALHEAMRVLTEALGNISRLVPCYDAKGTATTRIAAIVDAALSNLKVQAWLKEEGKT